MYFYFYPFFMKRNLLFYSLFLLVLTMGGLYASKDSQASFSAATPSIILPDTPGNGFLEEDPCGFLMGSSESYQAKYINVDGVSPDRLQACADENGKFYSKLNTKTLFLTRDSKVILRYGASLFYNLDLADTDYGVTVDQTTGYWSGYGKITDASFTGTNPWVWFDWNCEVADGTSGPALCDEVVSSSDLRVKTDLATGAVTGYAWNDNLGFIPFTGLTMELAEF